MNLTQAPSTGFGQPARRRLPFGRFGWFLIVSLVSPSAATSDEGGRKPIPPPATIASLPPDGGLEFNRLVFEKSPYLLQHAGNPVDWYPWGEAAFARARAEDKPIFLSIGYSTCHWCHVMERESFEDAEVAALMNKDFVSIKVDREERPDVDHIYMTVTQALTGSGGWPMTVILTPDRKPFFAGTYFPKRGRFGRAGMMELLPALAEAWKTRRTEIERSAEEIAGSLRALNARLARSAGDEPLNELTLRRGFHQLRGSFDADRGGFGSAPKFPTPQNLMFLLRYARRTGDAEATAMVEKTLTEMRRGGLFDQVGFGFHRYSTDPDWLLPHFEKMLCDQAMLALAYLEAYQATGAAPFAETARQTLDYVLRDMVGPEGGFYSAEDADSEGEEGKFYLWSVDEVTNLLGPETGSLFARVYQFEPEGNFRDQATGQRTGSNIPHLRRSLGQWAAELDLSESDLGQRLESARRKLFDVRKGRIHPLKDDKVLTDWNGLMIAATARAGATLGEPRYAEAAARAADFVLARLRDDRGRLLKRYRQGEASLPAHLEDYAFLAWGLVELYETTFEVRYLRQAGGLVDHMLARFWDAEAGGFFLTAEDGEPLLVRPKEVYDGAIPSGNSVAALVLLRLARLTGRMELEDRAQALFRAFSGPVAANPAAHAFVLLALDFALGPTYEIVIAGRPEAEDTLALLAALRGRFIPNKAVLLRPEPADAPPIVDLAEFTRPQRALDGRAAAYVCRNFVCRAPTTEPEAMLAALAEP